MKKHRKIYIAVSCALSSLYAVTARAQNTVYFSTSDPGQTKSIAQWGVEVVDGSSDNMRQSIANMGANNINLIAVNFWVDEPLQANGQIRPNSMSRINSQLAIAAMAGNKPIILGPNVGDTDASYLNGSQVSVAQWVKVLQATKTYLNSQNFTLGAVSPFNEPDYWSGQGTQQNLHDIMASLRSDPNFNSVSFVGASTLSSDPAQSWYDAISGVTQYGSTHVLGGSADSYANFFQHVSATGGIPSAPEVHELGEAIYAAEYGVQSAQWWGPALRARGQFVQASQGKQLGYSENRANDTAATVYRAPDGSIKAFAGGFERFGTSTAYRFVSTDRDVYFNGVGPIRQYMIQAGQGDEAYADIQYGSGILPALDGNRWEIVNKLTGQVLQVSGGTTTSGGVVNSATDTGALYQRWNVTRFKDGYYALYNANSGLTADVVGGSITSGAKLDQSGMADNLIQQWYIDPAGNGDYYIRNANSNLYLTTSTTNATQFNNVGSTAQQWQFVLANPVPSGTLKAQYNFEGSASDSTGVNNATVFGSPTYSSGAPGKGQAINLNGTNSYVQLPSGVANSSDITISTMVKWNGGNNWQRIFDLGTGTTSYMFLTPQSAGNTMRFAISNGGNTAEQILDTDPLPVGQWVQLAVTLSGNTGILYENGKPIVAGQILLNPSDINPTLNYIGKSQFSGDPLLNGSVDDFRIYNYALSQAQIASLVFRRWTGAVDSNWTSIAQASPKNWQFDTASIDYANGNSVLFDDYAGGFVVNVADTTVTPSVTQFDNTAHDYTLNGPGAIAGNGSLIKNGGGALTISNSNSYTGGTALNEGTLNLNNPNAIGTGTLSIAAAVTNIDNTSGAPVTLSTNNPQIWNGSVNFGGTNPLNMGTGPISRAGNTTLTVNGSAPVTLNAITDSGNLTKGGTGILILAGSSTYAGTTTVNAGTLSISGAINNNHTYDVITNAGATTSVTGSLNARFVDTFGGTLNVSGTGNVSDNGSQFSDGATGNISGGTFNVNGEMWAGQSGVGTVNQTGGTVTTNSYFVVGRGATGIYNLTNGTIVAATGGGYATLGSFAGANGTLNASGGSLITSKQLYIGEGGAGIVNLSSIGYINITEPTQGVRIGVNTGAVGTLNLDGGTLLTTKISAGSGSSTLNFNGGTIKPGTSNTTDFITGIGRTNIRNGGAIFDTSGFNATVAQPLLHSNIAGDNITDGGLTKLGNGTLTLAGSNNYTGLTAIVGGALVLKGAGTQAPVLSGGGADLKAGTLLLDYTGASDPITNVKTILGNAYASNFASGQIHTSNIQDIDKGIGYLDNTASSQLSLMYTYYGDTNLDGQVNTADFITLASNFGQSSNATWQQGDFNFDGAVNALDFNAIASNFGAAPISTSAPALGSLVPEPASLARIMASALLLTRWRRRLIE